MIYQAIPHQCIKSRNDDLIFNEIGYVFSVNMLLNGLWLMIFTRYNLTAFFISCIDIVGLLVTCLYMMMVVARAKYLNTFEVISAYTGFSMYAGWVTTATILNVTFCIKGLGYSEDKMDISESKIACHILWVAQIIYVVASFREENVVFAFIWLWAAFAILNRQREEHKDIEANLDLIIIVHSIYLFCLSIWKFYKWIKGKSVNPEEMCVDGAAKLDPEAQNSGNKKKSIIKKFHEEKSNVMN